MKKIFFAMLSIALLAGCSQKKTDTKSTAEEFKPTVYEHHQVLNFSKYGFGKDVVKKPFSEQVVYTIKQGDVITVSEFWAYKKNDSYVKVKTPSGIVGYISVGHVYPYSGKNYQYVETLKINDKKVRILSFFREFCVSSYYLFSLPSRKSERIYEITREELGNYYQTSEITENYDWAKININGNEGWIPTRELSVDKGGSAFITPSDVVYQQLIGQYDPDPGI